MPENRTPIRRTDMIHCENCGEDYSATYKHCPFCDEEAPRRTPSRSGGGHSSGRGGKRVAAGHSSGGRGSGGHGGGEWDFNLFRIIGIVVPLCFIAAALYIIITVLGPMISAGHESPNASASGSPEASQPVASSSGDPSGSPQATGTAVTGITLDQTDVTIPANGMVQLHATITPSDADAEVVWTVDNTDAATISQDGLVTNTNTGGSRVTVTVTATAGDFTAACTVRCEGSAAQPSSSGSGSEGTTTGGTLSAGPAVVANADGGVRVRSGPSTSSEILASLFNGNAVNIVSDAGDGWYQITFDGNGGVETTGYILGEYLSQN